MLGLTATVDPFRIKTILKKPHVGAPMNNF